MKYNSETDISALIDAKEQKAYSNTKFLTKTLMYRFLSEVERITEDRNITRRKLATMVGTSPSYITQLYRGNKVISLEMLAKLESALDFEFIVQAKTSAEKVSEHLENELRSFTTINRFNLNNTRLRMFSQLEDNLSHEVEDYRQKFSSKGIEGRSSYSQKLKIVA